MPESLHALVCEYLCLGLRANSTCLSAYQLVVDYNCLGLLAQTYRYNPEVYNSFNKLHSVVAVYITGLSGPPVNDKEQYINYLLQPLIIQMVILSVVSLRLIDPPFAVSHLLWDQQQFEPLANHLLRLRPDAQVWDDCRRWLMSLSDWMESNKDVNQEAKKQSFIGNGLVEPLIETFFLESVMPSGVDVHSNIRQIISMLDDLSSSKEVSLEFFTESVCCC